MFTIRWEVKTTHGIITRLYEANEITVAYRNGALPAHGSPERQLPPWEVADRQVDQALLILDPHLIHSYRLAGRSFDAGTVYVINETGATVGKFVLGDDIEADQQPLHVAA